MQKERLIIKNFFTLKDVDIELGKYNAFIGEQASGKSLIVKLLYFFRDNIYLPIIEYEKKLNEAKKDMVNEFNELFHLYGNSRNFIVQYINADNQLTVERKEGKLTIFPSECLNKFYKVHRKAITTIMTLSIDGDKDSINLDPKLERSILQKMQKYLRDNRLIEHNFVIPAGRTLFTNLKFDFLSLFKDSKSKVIDNMYIEFGSSYGRIFKNWKFINDITNRLENLREILLKVNDISRNIMKGKFEYDKDGGFIITDEIKLRVQHTSSGQQEFFPIYITLLDYIAVSIVKSLYVEEPEAHLYPSAQKAITELLVYVTNATNSDGLYITTHSPYILTVLNNLILANDVKDKQKLFDKDLLVPFEEVRAYYIADGGARDLRDYENRLILADNLDKVSEQTALDFDNLLDLKYE